MFKEINDYRIRVHKGNGIHYVPNVISIDPINKLFIATEWLVEEAVKDYNNTHARIKERREKEGYSQKNLDELEEMGVRLGSRTQSYVNQLCLIEDILIYEYKRMAELMKEASGGKINFDPEKDTESLKERFANIRLFRNKVVAHTAYTYPKINRKTGESEDNPETIVRSMLNLFPSEGKITLGDNFFNGFSGIKSQLPIISIFEWDTSIKLVFKDWEKLFTDKLELIHRECPLQNGAFKIEVASPHLITKKKQR